MKLPALVAASILLFTSIAGAQVYEWSADSLPGVKTLDTGPCRRHHADNLVARHNRVRERRQFAIDYMQVGAANTAYGNAQQNLSAPGTGGLAARQFEPLARPVQLHLAHAGSHRLVAATLGVYAPDHLNVIARRRTIN